jgi:hypothetical protein
MLMVQGGSGSCGADLSVWQAPANLADAPGQSIRAVERAFPTG